MCYTDILSGVSREYAYSGYFHRMKAHIKRISNGVIVLCYYGQVPPMVQRWKTAKMTGSY